MLNSHLFNTRLFNGNFVNNEVLSTDLLSFEGFSLTSDGMTLTRLLDSGPTREVQGGAIPRGNGRYVTRVPDRQRVIEAWGIATKPTQAELETFMDEITRSLRYVEGDLDRVYANGVVKRFRATMVSFDELYAEKQHYHINVTPWHARFICEDPYGYSRDYTSLSLSLSSLSTTQSIVNEGTAEGRPVVILIFDSASSVTGVNLSNNTTEQEIEINESISAGDILVFDSERMEVTLNGVQKDFEGAFPILDVGPNLIQITVTGASYSAYATYKHKTPYR